MLSLAALFIALGFYAAFCAPQIANAQTPPSNMSQVTELPRTNREVVTGLEYSLVVDRTIAQPGEEILHGVWIKNISREPMRDFTLRISLTNSGLESRSVYSLNPRTQVSTNAPTNQLVNANGLRFGNLGVGESIVLFFKTRAAGANLSSTYTATHLEAMWDSRPWVSLGSKEALIGSYIRLLSPNGGEVYRRGESVTIRWDSWNVKSVMIGWSIGEGSYENITTSPVPNTGSYSWNATKGTYTGTAFKIIITGYVEGPTSVGTVTDQTDGYYFLG